MTERGPFHPAVPKNDPEYDQARENLLTVLADIDAYDGHREKIEEMVKQYTCYENESENREENVEIFREHFGLTASGERRSYLDVGLDHNLSAATAQRRAEEVILFILRYAKLTFDVEEFLCDIFGGPHEKRHIPYLYSKLPKKMELRVRSL